jgi:hypothetical protein
MFTPDAIALLKEKAVEQIDPAIHHLTELAAAEKTRNQIGALIKHEVHAYYENLPFFKKFFVSRENLLDEVDDLVNKSLPKRIEETLKGEFFAEEARAFIGTSIDNALAKPLPVVMGTVAPEQLDRLKEQVARSVLSIVHSEETATGITAYLTKSTRSREIVPFVVEMEDHPDPAPPYGRERAKQIQEVEQGAVAMKDLVIAQRVKVPVSLEALGQPAQRRSALDQRHLRESGSRQRQSRGHSREATTQHDDRGRTRLTHSADPPGIRDLGGRQGRLRAGLDSTRRIAGVGGRDAGSIGLGAAKDVIYARAPPSDC